jgi:hypothetical protein
MIHPPNQGLMDRLLWFAAIDAQLLYAARSHLYAALAAKDNTRGLGEAWATEDQAALLHGRDRQDQREQTPHTL